MNIFTRIKLILQFRKYNYSRELRYYFDKYIPDSLNTKMFKAIESANYSLLSSLIDSGANVNAIDKSASKPAKYGALIALTLPQIRNLMGEDYLNTRDEEDEIYCNILRLLIKKGANVNGKHKIPVKFSLDQFSYISVSPLFQSAHRNKLNQVKILIEAGADLNFISSVMEGEYVTNQSSNLNFTPLTMAIYSGHCEVAILLIESGASLNLGKNIEVDAMKVAELSKNTKMLAYLSNILLNESLANLPKVNSDQTPFINKNIKEINKMEDEEVVLPATNQNKRRRL